MSVHENRKPYRMGTTTFHESINSPPESSGGSAIAGAAGPGALGAAAAVAAAAAAAAAAAVPAIAVDAARARRVASESGGREGRMSFSSGGGAPGVGVGAGALLFPAAGIGGGGGSGDGYDNSPENPFAGAGPEYHHHPDGGVPGVSAAGVVAGGQVGPSSTHCPFGSGGGMAGNPFTGVGGDGTPGGGGGGVASGGVTPLPFRAGAKNAASAGGGGDAGGGAGGGGVAAEGQGGGVGGVGGGGEGDFSGFPLGPRKASSAFSEPGISRSVVAAGVAGVGMRKEWKYQLEGNSERWEQRKVKMLR